MVEVVPMDDGKERNVFHTYFQKVHRTLSDGIDFDTDCQVMVEITELTNIQFNYSIEVNFDKINKW